MIEILVIGIIIFMIVSLIGYWIGKYNFFQATKEAIDTQWSNVVTEYERRVDLFINLAKNVKSFKKHERDTLVELTKARSGLQNPKTQKSSLKKIDSLLSGLNINVEAYPELKASGLFADFMGEIRITEDRINGARTGYNAIIREYETMRVTFPSNIVAQHHNFKEINYYDSGRDDVTGKAPEVDV